MSSMYSDEAVDKVSEEKKAYNKGLIVLSLTINILLAAGGWYLYYQNQQLSIELSNFTSKVDDLTKIMVDLEQQLNMSQVQLEYYKDLTDYYSTHLVTSSNASGIIGEADIPILAVQTKRTLFETEYAGNVLHAELELQEGEGRILVNTEVFNGIDIQTSARTAVAVVEKLLEVSFGNTDIILTITASDQVEAVDGPSAGGAITVALIAALEHVNIMDGVYMTGTINSDGTIGAVGAVPYKALAAAEDGADKILVPVNQGSVTLYEPKTVRVGRFTHTVYEKTVIDLEDYLSNNGFIVDVIEVGSIMDAYNIFTGKL